MHRLSNILNIISMLLYHVSSNIYYNFKHIYCVRDLSSVRLCFFYHIFLIKIRGKQTTTQTLDI